MGYLIMGEQVMMLRFALASYSHFLYVISIRAAK